MARNVKVELYDGSIQGRGFYTVEIPVPAKYDHSRVVEGQRKVVIRNWGRNDYSVGLFDRADACETANIVRGKMTDVVNAAAEWLYT